MKLFNKTIDRQLFKQYPLGSDLANQEVIVKIFNPMGAGNWFIMNSDPQDPDYLWGIVDLGYGAEIGSISRSQLENYRGRFGLGFERDLSFEPVNALELYQGLNRGEFYAKGGGVGSSEENTFDKIFLHYGFTKKRGAYGVRPYEHKKLGTYAQIDDKTRSIEIETPDDEYKGGYSVKGVIDFLKSKGFEETGSYADGGDISEFSENQRMIMNQNVQIEHHQEELEDLLEERVEVPAWVVAKMETATKNLSDIYHYLDGQKEVKEEIEESKNEEDIEVEDFEVVVPKTNSSGVDSQYSDYYQNIGSFESGGLALANDPNFFNVKGFADGGGIGFIPMDLEEKLRITAKWGGTNIKGVIGILNAMIDSGLTDQDLQPKPTKSGSAYQNAVARKTKEIWAKIEPNYKGDFKGNMYYSTIRHLVERSETSDNILKRFKPFRKYQNDSYADGGYFDGTIPKASSYMSTYNKGGKITPKKYIDHDDIESVTLNVNTNFITFSGKDVLNGANLMEKGGNLSDIAVYYPKRDVVKVKLKNGETVKPLNGYWLKKGAKPFSSPSVSSASSKSTSVGNTSISKGYNGWKAETYIDDFQGKDYRISTFKSSKGDLVSSAQGGKSEKTGSKQVKIFSYTAFQDPYYTLEVTKPNRITEKSVAEQHGKALNKFKKFMDSGSFKGGGKISKFDKLSAKVAKQYEGKPVKSQYQEEYGKFYSKEEAREIGDKVAGKVKALQSMK